MSTLQKLLAYLNDCGECPNLKWADLGNANLAGADLRNENLFHADLGNAVLCDCNLDGAAISFRGKTIRVRFEEVWESTVIIDEKAGEA